MKTKSAKANLKLKAKRKSTAGRKVKVKIKKSGDRPVTQKMLYGVRSELKHDITSVKLDLKGDIKRVEGQIKGLEGEIKRVDSKVDKLDSKIEQVLSVLNHMRVDTEEQKRNNKLILDGYILLDERLTRVEAKLP
jgi:septal ring factor EnvC (AmiA/AmiB activator)